MSVAGKAMAKVLLAALLCTCAIVGAIYFGLRLVFGTAGR